MHLIKTNTNNQILTSLVEAIELHQSAFKDFESAGRGLSNTAHPLDMKFWTRDLENALGNKEETAALLLRRREALLTHMGHLANAREAYERIVDYTQQLSLVIAEAYAYLEGERPKEAALIKANLLLAIHEHSRKIEKLVTFDGPQGQLIGELNEALTDAFEQLAKQNNYCHLANQISSHLSLPGSAYPVAPAASDNDRTQKNIELRNLPQPNKAGKFSFPSAVFTTMEEELEELLLVWKTFNEFSANYMRVESGKLGEEHFGLQLLKLAKGELHAGYGDSIPKQQNGKRLSYERIHTQYLALGRELETARRKVALSLQKAKAELQPLMPESKQNPHHTSREYQYSIKPAQGPCKPIATKHQLQHGALQCLYTDLVLRDIGRRFTLSLEDYGRDVSGGKAQEALDAELKKLRERFEVKIQITKDTARTNALKLRQEAAAASTAPTVDEKHLPPVQPPAGAITNVY